MPQGRTISVRQLGRINLEVPPTNGEESAGGAGLLLCSEILYELRDERAEPPLPVRTHADRLRSGARGLSLSSLRGIRAFYEEHSGLDLVMGDVCKKSGFRESVCAITRSTGLSLAESIVLGANGRDVSELIGPATSFFSYSWDGTKLGDMLDAIERTLAALERADGRPRFAWVDMFCASQNLLAGVFRNDAPHGSADRAARKEDTDRIFDDAIDSVDELLLYSSPLAGEWRAPPHPYLLAERGTPPAEWIRRGPGAMTRAWCMFEMVKALSKGCTLHVVLCKSDLDGLQTLLMDRFDDILQILSALDARDAQISKTEDRAYILGQIEGLDGGLGTVTASVCAALREWLVAEALATLERMPSSERGTSTLLMKVAMLLRTLGKLDEAEPLYVEAAEARRARFPNAADTYAAINNLGGLLKAKGQLDAAEGLFQEALAGYRHVLGPEHPNTLAMINNVGSMLQARGELAEATSLFRESLDAKRRLLGDAHADTITSITNLASVLKARKKLNEAEPLFREALGVRRSVLGNRHPQTLASITNLGSMAKARGNLAEAESLFREALEAKREVSGSRHPSTLISITNVGSVLKAQGKLDEAEPFFREALDAKRETSGDRHPGTLTSITNFASLLKAQGKADEAEPLFREALEGRRAVLGDRHPSTISSMKNLAYTLQDLGRGEEADALLQEAGDAE